MVKGWSHQWSRLMNVRAMRNRQHCLSYKMPLFRSKLTAPRPGLVTSTRWVARLVWWAVSTTLVGVVVQDRHFQMIKIKVWRKCRAFVNRRQQLWSQLCLCFSIWLGFKAGAIIPTNTGNIKTISWVCCGIPKYTVPLLAAIIGGCCLIQC